MDWVSHNSRSRSEFAQLASHVNEFIPRSSATTPQPFIVSTNKNLEESPESQSPPTTNSPTLPAYQENVGGTTYFYQYPSSGAEPEATTTALNSSSSSNTPLPADYNVYTVAKSSFFIVDDLRNDILNRNALSLMQPDPQQLQGIPHEVESYHELVPLEPTTTDLHSPLPKPLATMYKATHMKSGSHYCLRRIHDFRLQNAKCLTLDLWKKLTHSNIVQLKEVFTTKLFGDTSMIFVYDYHPGSETLLNKHFVPPVEGGGAFADPFMTDSATPRPYSYQKNHLMRHQQNNKLPEPLIWNYIIQLTSALRLLHASSLACRSLDPTKIIITSRNRLRLSCLGVMDVILHDSNTTLNHHALVQHYQQEDLTALGKLVLALACKSTSAVQRENIQTALDLISRSYTSDLRNLIVYLLSAQQRRSVTDLMPMIGARFYTQLDSLHNHIELLDHELSKEIQNGRLFRLMTKLATINERPEFNLDAGWSETGDRYMLKLFRDYVFHQVTEEGRPWLDMAHIIQCLNKLDTGVQEKICLMSRDEQTVLVVSYAELKHCLEQSFCEVAGGTSAADGSDMEK